MPITFFKRKADALQALGNGILCNKNIKDFFILDSYKSFIDTINNSQIKDYYECIFSKKPINCFFDIEIYKNLSPNEFINCKLVLDHCINTIHDYIGKEFNIKKIILESHNDIKKSFHVILHISDKNNISLLFNTTILKSLYSLLKFDVYKAGTKYLIDPSVYREGLFRTIYSSKSGEIRPLVKSSFSDPFDDIESFVSFVPTHFNLFKTKKSPQHKSPKKFDNDIIDLTNIDMNIDSDIEFVNEPQELNLNDKQLVTKFIQKEYSHFPNKIRDIIIDKDYNCIIVSLTEKFCHFIEREHTSNHQYIIIDTSSSKQKCHNSNCNEHKFKEIKMEDYPKEINEIIKKCLKINKQELDLIDRAIIECTDYINENFDNTVNKIQFDKNEMLFRGDVQNNLLVSVIGGKCNNCHVEHQIGNSGYCLKCKICNSTFPKNQLIPIDDRYKNLNSFWNSYSQLVNHGTINNIINIYQNSGEEDFSCDVQLDSSIISDKVLLKIINECLDGHKITKMAELMFNMYNDYVYTGSDWFYFSDCLGKWILDQKSLNFKKHILDLCTLFNKIKQHYENKKVNNNNNINLIKNIKSLITKINKPQLKEDILKDSQLFYIDPNFFSKLNSKKHLLPFNNGVFDLLSNSFRKTTKDDYINLTVNYDYSDTENPEVFKFLREVIPNEKVRDYILKKMSECLNGDIPNTYFLMFIGDTGANGKSQLLNLMKLTMGDFGEKVEVTLLTRKRNNANEANSEKIKLLNKRFAFLSEPEDGEKINIGLLKELTGSEEIVARGLYQESLSFIMEAKLFLACNELPEIKGEDTALWRRIRVIDFPSRFVDNPKEPNEYKIDRTLPSRMREDVSWRQTFMKILLDYYNKDVSEPDEVKVKTNEYKQVNNDFYNWCDENIKLEEGSILKLSDVCELFLGKKVPSRVSTKYKKELEKYIKEKYKTIQWDYRQFRIKDIVYKGWQNITLI